MAYQDGTIRFKGSDLSITFYRMKGEYHIRAKSSLTGKKFWKDPSFENSRRSCKRFAEGNKLASQVYRSLPIEQRQYPLFCQLKLLAILYIKEGVSTEDILGLLTQRAGQEKHFIKPTPKKKPPKTFPYALQITRNYVAISLARFLQLVNIYGEEKLVTMAEAILEPPPLQQLQQAMMLRRA